MTIYVDELPKSCWDCPCHKGDDGLCKLLQEYTDYVPKSCPLIPLSDYTKQVRKEVCEKIKEQSEHSNLGYMGRIEKGYYTITGVALETILKEYQK